MSANSLMLHEAANSPPGAGRTFFWKTRTFFDHVADRLEFIRVMRAAPVTNTARTEPRRRI